MPEASLLVLAMQRPPGRPLADAAAAVFAQLLAIFAPRRFVYSVDLGELRYVHRGGPGRWDGEELTSGALTLCEPGEAAALVDELAVTLAQLAISPTAQLWVGAEGALRHRAPRAHAPAWYGRWRKGRSLHDLVELSLGWCDEQCGLEIGFPNDGYPLTSAELRAEPIGERWIDGGDPTAAADNRGLWLSALAGLPEALGLARDDVRWQLSGELDALAVRYPDDVAALRGVVARLGR